MSFSFGNPAINMAINEYKTLGISGVRPIVSEEAIRNLQARASSSRVRLSGFGQLKSAVAELQSSAKSLSSPLKFDTLSNAKSTTQGFLSTFNKVNSTVSSLTSPGNSSQKAGSLYNDSRASQSLTSLRQSISRTPLGTESLSKIGINFQKDGSLSLNSSKFEQAFQADPTGVTNTLNKLGSRVEATADKLLSGRGDIGTAIDRETQRGQAAEEDTKRAENRVDELVSRFEDPFARFGQISQALKSYASVATL